MKNETVTLSREDLEFALGFKCHGYKSLTDQAADKLHAQGKIRAALAEPVPPAGGEVEVEGYKYRIKNRPNRAWTYAKDQPQQFSEEFDIAPLYAQHVVTRLQAEVERLNIELLGRAGTIGRLVGEKSDLQAELTKAREYIQSLRGVAHTKGGITLDASIDAFLAHQSAPAAKDDTK